MNDPSSKKILFNKSTLFSLKAELLRKQEEVQEKKQLPQHKLENFKSVQVKVNENKEPSRNKGKKSFKDSLKAVDTEELEACRKTKLALEKKAELYEHLSDGAGFSQLADRFLVDFSTKKQQEQIREASPIPEPENISYDDDDNEWIEFTDCLGRTRKCLKSDLDLYKRKDNQLMKTMDLAKLEEKSQENCSVTTVQESKIEEPTVVQKTNDYLQSLREKWEQKEKELMSKDADIHYQDVLFDEARMHGVGYFSFSTDEKERRKQMDELLRRREETLRAQKEAEGQRKQRDELMAARVAAARARRRAREGLPPEEPQENKKDFTTCLLEYLNKQKDEADNKAKEKEKKIREEQEIERQKLREAYVREWDIGKEGVDEKLKKFREMSQEEYVEQQRAERIEEFAPPQSSSAVKSNYVFDNHGRMVVPDSSEPAPTNIWADVRAKPKTTQSPNFVFNDHGKMLVPNSPEPAPTKTWADVRPKPKTPPPPDISDVSEQKGLYFSTATKPQCNLKYKNFIKAKQPTPIVNELDEEDCEQETRKPEKRQSETDYASIAPPPTYDYYGPVPKQSKTQKPFESNLREAYAQGAKSLESKASNIKLPSHYDFTFD